MKMTPSQRLLTAALLLSALLPSAPAGEVLPPNPGFDADISGWSWEDWSMAGSTATFDAALDANNSPASGSLRLNSNFDPAVLDWQQAVYTLPLPAEVNAGESYNSLSFDVRVDPVSAMTLDGTYGQIQVILRNGTDWTWAELAFIPLTSTEWMRVTARFSAATVPIDAVRAITLRVADDNLTGPVIVNLDNFAFTEEVIIDALDNGFPDTPPNGWTWENWSAADSTVTWDPLDFYGRATSGSARLFSNFQDIPGYQQAVFTFPLPAQENAGVNFSHINLDLKVDPSSTPRAAGDYGFFEIILRNGSGWEWVATGPLESSGTRLSSTEWVHISMPIRSGDQVNAITLKLGENDFDGPITLNIDNVTWTRNTAPPPPPTLTLAPSQPGLNLVATSTDQYGRHNIYSADGYSLGWSDAPEPVTYEFSILDFPDATAFPGFQAHLFLVPGAPGTATSPDWNEPSLIFLDIKAGEGGTGNATLRWKNNEPGGNSQLYSGGLSNVTSATILGTWKVTVDAASHFIVTAPDGATTEFDLPAEAAASFAGPIRVYVGAQPNATANIGQGIIVGHVRISQGATVLLEDDFSGETLDELKWVANSTPGGVQLIPPGDAGWILNWTLPDSGFFLQTTPTLDNPVWTGVPVTPVNLGPLMRQAVVPGAGLSSDMAFFRLVQVQLVAPANHTALAGNMYTLTNALEATWDLVLSPFDDTTGSYTFGETGQGPDSGSYVVTSDLSNNQWNVELTSFFGGGPQTLSLRFESETSGTWTYTGELGGSSGPFTATPLFP